MLQSNQSSLLDASIVSSSRMTVKITCENSTKRVRDVPETFESLKSTVKTQMNKGTTATQYIKNDQFAITYQDDTGDVINLSDDEDLQAAYEVAENFMNRQLKLTVNQR